MCGSFPSAGSRPGKTRSWRRELEASGAAQAGGQQPDKTFNCRVTSGSTIITGHALANANSGKQNGWGLANFVGNAQEWAKSGGSVVVRGGKFDDPLDECDISLSRPHGGNADAVTGFRLVRELG